VYDDLNLIFLNALHYNIEDSQIAKDANTLKVRSKRAGHAVNRDRFNAYPFVQGILEAEWTKRPSLPSPGRQTSVNQRRASSEVDIDGGISESEPTNETSRVAQSDEIVKQLEKSVPRWEGFGPGGWTITIQLVRFYPLSFPGSCLDEGVQADALLIVEQIRDYKDARYALAFAFRDLVIPTHPYSGVRLSAVLDAVPDMDSKLNFPQVVRGPCSR